MEKNKLRWYKISVFAIIFFGALGLLLCVHPTDAWSRKIPSVIKIGTAVSESGFLAEDSMAGLRSQKLAFKQVNDEGGIYLSKYHKKIPIKLIRYDAMSQPSTAVHDFFRLVDSDHVVVLIAPFSSTLSYATSKIAGQRKIPMVIWGGYANKIWNRGNKWIFNVGPLGSEYSLSLVNLVKTLPGNPKVGLIAEGGLWAKTVAKFMVKEARQQGLHFDLVDIYPPNTNSVTPSILKVVAGNYDIIGTVSHYHDDLLFTHDLLQLNVRNKFKLIYEQSAAGYPSFAQNYTPAQIQGIVGTSVGALTLNTYGNKKFVSKYTNTYGKKPSWIATIGYAGAQVAIEAIKLAGSLNNNDIREALLTHTFKTVIGNLKFKKNGTSEGSIVGIVQMQSGMPIVVSPKKYSTGKLIYPQPYYKK